MKANIYVVQCTLNLRNLWEFLNLSILWAVVVTDFDTEWACFLCPCSCHMDQLPALYPHVTEHLRECCQHEALSPALPPLGRLCPFPHTALPMCAHQCTFSGFLWPCWHSWLYSMSLFMFGSPFSLHVIFTSSLHFCLQFPLSVTHFDAMAHGFVAGRGGGSLAPRSAAWGVWVITGATRHLKDKCWS